MFMAELEFESWMRQDDWGQPKKNGGDLRL